MDELSANALSEGWFTVAVLEDVQHAIVAGKRVDEFLRSLRWATLPALIEYCCYSSTNKRAPALPPILRSSSAGVEVFAGSAAKCSIPALRVAQKPATVDVRGIEVVAVETQDELESEAWGLFEARFNRSAQSVGFERKCANKLQAALFEMVENAFLHSASPWPHMVGYAIMDHTVQFCVADAGIGVLASLQSCSDYANLRFHSQAIRTALQDGTSRFGHNRGGLGFREVFKSLASDYGRLRFRSGEGCILMDGRDLDADRGEEHFPPYMAGFQVTVVCSVREPALAFPIM